MSIVKVQKYHRRKFTVLASMLQLDCIYNYIMVLSSFYIQMTIYDTHLWYKIALT